MVPKAVTVSQRRLIKKYGSLQAAEFAKAQESAKQEIKESGIETSTSIEDYTAKYQTLSTQSKKYLKSPTEIKTAIEADKTQTIANNQTLISSKIKELQDKMQKKHKYYRDRKKKYQKKGDDERAQEMEDKLDEYEAYYEGVIEGLQKNKNTYASYNDIYSYAKDLGRYERDKEEARNEGQRLQEEFKQQRPGESKEAYNQRLVEQMRAGGLEYLKKSDPQKYRQAMRAIDTGNFYTPYFETQKPTETTKQFYDRMVKQQKALSPEYKKQFPETKYKETFVGVSGKPVTIEQMKSYKPQEVTTQPQIIQPKLDVAKSKVEITGVKKAMVDYGKSVSALFNIGKEKVIPVASEAAKKVTEKEKESSEFLVTNYKEKVVPKLKEFGKSNVATFEFGKKKLKEKIIPVASEAAKKVTEKEKEASEFLVTKYKEKVAPRLKEFGESGLATFEFGKKKLKEKIIPVASEAAKKITEKEKEASEFLVARFGEAKPKQKEDDRLLVAPTYPSGQGTASYIPKGIEQKEPIKKEEFAPSVMYLGDKEIRTFKEPQFGTVIETGFSNVEPSEKITTLVQDIQPDYSQSPIKRIEEFVPFGGGAALTQMEEQIYLPDESASKKYEELLEAKRPGAAREMRIFLREQQAQLKKDIGKYNLLLLKSSGEKGLTEKEYAEAEKLRTKINQGQRGTLSNIVYKETEEKTKAGEYTNISPRVLRRGLKFTKSAYEAEKSIALVGAGMGIAAPLVGTTAAGASAFGAATKVVKYAAPIGGAAYSGVTGYKEYQKTGDIGDAIAAATGTAVGFFGTLGAQAYARSTQPEYKYKEYLSEAQDKKIDLTGKKESVGKSTSKSAVGSKTTIGKQRLKKVWTGEVTEKRIVKGELKTFKGKARMTDKSYAETINIGDGVKKVTTVNEAGVTQIKLIKDGKVIWTSSSIPPTDIRYIKQEIESPIERKYMEGKPGAKKTITTTGRQPGFKITEDKSPLRILKKSISGKSKLNILESSKNKIRIEVQTTSGVQDIANIGPQKQIETAKKGRRVIEKIERQVLPEVKEGKYGTAPMKADDVIFGRGGRRLEIKIATPKVKRTVQQFIGQKITATKGEGFLPGIVDKKRTPFFYSGETPAPKKIVPPTGGAEWITGKTAGAGGGTKQILLRKEAVPQLILQQPTALVSPQVIPPMTTGTQIASALSAGVVATSTSAVVPIIASVWGAAQTPRASRIQVVSPLQIQQPIQLQQPVEESAQESMTRSLTISGTTQAQESLQETITETITQPITEPITEFVPEPTIPETTTPTIAGGDGTNWAITGIDFGGRKRKKTDMVQAYAGQVMVGGKYKTVTTKPYTKKGALDVVARVVDNTTAAQGKPVPLKKKVDKSKIQKGDGYYERTKDKFRGFKIFGGQKKQLKDTIIEKKNKRLDTPGETSGMTVAQFTSRARKTALGIPTRKTKKKSKRKMRI